MDAGQLRSRPCRRDGRKGSGSRPAACRCCGSDVMVCPGLPALSQLLVRGAAAAVMELHLRLAGPFMVARTRNSSHWDCRFLFLVPARLPDTQCLSLPSAQSSCRQDRMHVFTSFFFLPPPALSLSVSSSILIPPSIRPTAEEYISCLLVRSLAHSHSCRPMSWFIYEL